MLAGWEKLSCTVDICVEIYLRIVCFCDELSKLLGDSKGVYEPGHERLPKGGRQEEGDQGRDQGGEGHLGTREDTPVEIYLNIQVKMTLCT